MSGRAVLDEAALTGEPLPCAAMPGEEIRSGASVVGEAIEVVALRPAAASTFARIVHLVERAEADRPRTARLADRAAVIFLPITLAVAGLGWAVSGIAGRGAGRARRRDAVPAHPGNADRVRLGPRAGGAARHRRQGRHAARATRSGDGGRLRQDRDADVRAPAGCRGIATSCWRWQPRPNRARRILWPRRSAPRPECEVSPCRPPTASARPTETASKPASAAGWCASAGPRSSGVEPDGPRTPGVAEVWVAIDGPPPGCHPVLRSAARRCGGGRRACARGGRAPGAADGRLRRRSAPRSARRPASRTSARGDAGGQGGGRRRAAPRRRGRRHGR